MAHVVHLLVGHHLANLPNLVGVPDIAFVRLVRLETLHKAKNGRSGALGIIGGVPGGTTAPPGVVLLVAGGVASGVIAALPTLVALSQVAVLLLQVHGFPAASEHHSPFAALPLVA